MKTLEIHNYDTKYEGLKPCPFCGSQPIWHQIGNGGDVTPSRTVVIECPNCRVKMEMSAHYNSVELAEHILEKWNKRIY